MRRIIKGLALIAFLSLALLCSTKSYASSGDEDDKTSESSKSSKNDALLTGTGLVAVGGAGGCVIAYNKKKREENTPSKEIEASGSEEL